jgi:ATP-dependent RNA helicase SUPV3L1/SUV3
VAGSAPRLSGRGLCGAGDRRARQPSGDIDTLQGRIAAIRSWSYIAQRPDWVLARDEMAARARAVETRLSDALHAPDRTLRQPPHHAADAQDRRRRCAPARAAGRSGAVLVDDEAIGHLDGFRFVVDPLARAADRKLLLAAAERHLPGLLATRAQALAAMPERQRNHPRRWRAVLERHHGGAAGKGRTLLEPRIRIDAALDRLSSPVRQGVETALGEWLARHGEKPLEPLRKIAEAGRDPASGPTLRALLLRLVEGGGVLAREEAGLERLDDRQRAELRGLGIRVGALDLYVPGALRPAAMVLWSALARLWDLDHGAPAEAMRPVVRAGKTPVGYRTAGSQAIRVDLAEKLLQAAHRTRTEGAIGGRTRRFALDPALARSMGLTTASYAALLRAADSARGPAPAGEGAAGRPRRRCGTGAPRARATNAGPKPPPPARQRLCRAGGMVAEPVGR